MGDFLSRTSARLIPISVVVRLGLLLLATAFPLLAGWQPIGPFGGPLQTIAVDPQHPNVVLAASANAAVFQSHDAGASWTLLRFPAESRATLHALVFDPGRSGIIFASLTSENFEYAGVYRSIDSGITWRLLPAMRGQQAWSLAISASGEIAAGTESGVYLSTDAGETWRATSLNRDARAKPAVSLAFSAHEPGILYVGTPHLAWKTSEHASKWVAIHNGMPDDSDVFSISPDPVAAGRIYLSACSGLYISTSAGASWSALSVPGGISNRTYFVAAHPLLRDYVYAGTASGVIRSEDGGVHWRTISPLAARAIAFDPMNAGRIYLATEKGTLRSDDGGDHLIAANQGLSTWRLARLAQGAGVLYAGSQDSSTPFPIVVRPSPAPAAGGVYVLAGREALHSSDGGRVWIRLPAPERVGALLSIASDTLLIANGSAILRTSDSGHTWNRLETPPLDTPIREIVALGGSAAAAFGDHELLWSPDGSHWMIQDGLPPNTQIHGLAGNGSGVLLAATSAGLLRSSNFGYSWRPVPGELATISIQAVARDPNRPQTFVAAAFGAVYASQDGGSVWRRLDPEGAPIGSIRQLLISGDSHMLFALTEEHGVFAWLPGDTRVHE